MNDGKALQADDGVRRGGVLPVPDGRSRPFWEAAAAGELRLPCCCRCGILHFPPPARCPACLGAEFVWTRLSGRGGLRSWTELFVEAIPGAAPPTIVVEVELAEQAGLVVVASGGDPRLRELELDSQVQVIFRETDERVFLPFVVPVESGSA